MKYSRILFFIVVFSSITSSIASVYVFGLFQKQETIHVPENTNTITSDVTSLKNISVSLKDVAKNLSPSVVSIIISRDFQVYRTDPFGFFYEPSGVQRKKVGGGTWFFVTKDGLILTNKHVVSDPGATYTIITASNEEFTGKVIATDPTTDLALIQAYSSEKKLEWRTVVSFVEDTNSIEVGDFLLAIGNALAEFKNTVTFWVVSALGRTIEAGDIWGADTELLTWLIQTDAAINPGNSGWPLVNLDGKVIGINTAIASNSTGLGFAIPLSKKEVDYLIQSAQKYGKIKRAYMGVYTVPLTQEIAKWLKLPITEGDLIDPSTIGTAPGSPAQKSWLVSGDVIVEINGITISGGKTVRDIIKTYFPGDELTMKVWKKATGKIEVVWLKLEER